MEIRSSRVTFAQELYENRNLKEIFFASLLPLNFLHKSLTALFSLAHKSKNVYNLSDICIRDHDVRTARIAMAKFFTLQAQAIAGFSSCGEAACYPEILRISYNFVQDNICIGQIT